MADLPIIFSAPMVRALLDGHKTQTRRVQHKDVSMAGSIYNSSGRPIAIDATAWDRRWPVRTRYAVGDRLYVREACAFDGPIVRYYATDHVHELRKKRPSIHMPRWASRITLTVTDVRVQQLSEISEADAVAEGCKGFVSRDGEDGLSPQEEYRALWNSLHGPGAWEANPWVAAYTFTVARGNIDQQVAR